MLESHMKFCMAEPDFAEQIFPLKNWENGPKMGFLNILKNLVIGSFHVKWTKAGHDPSQFSMKLFQMKGIHEIRLSLKFQHKLITYSKVMTPQSWHFKLKIEKTRGVWQPGCIFESQ